MGKSIARKRKRQFYGNRHTNDSMMNSSTASSSKLNDSLVNNNDSDGKEDFSGNRIFDLSMLSLVFNKLACPQCSNLGFIFEEDSRYGLCSNLVLKCHECKFTEGFSTSPKINNASEINMRFVYGMRQIGKGYSGAKLFCATLNLPPPPARSAFNKRICIQ
nr:uncharacterized protein LOC122273921 [Parasteatoda tepidariorum]